ncbi:hypothetical protein C8R44DRAFT_861025 [Mycena epipterygia]|nr:hypothetical protein C8R44DRAFT_861025 [Mycena epipterygia]
MDWSLFSPKTLDLMIGDIQRSTKQKAKIKPNQREARTLLKKVEEDKSLSHVHLHVSTLFSERKRKRERELEQPDATEETQRVVGVSTTPAPTGRRQIFDGVVILRKPRKKVRLDETSEHLSNQRRNTCSVERKPKLEHIEYQSPAKLEPKLEPTAKLEPKLESA